MEFVSGLVDLGYEIISTGGTKKTLEAAGIKTIGISDVTGFPEIMDGRVKTLHPKVHGALLCVRDNPDHVRQIKELGIEYIDLVCVNLYPFKQTVQKPGVSHEEIIENIDIAIQILALLSSPVFAFVVLSSCKCSSSSGWFSCSFSEFPVTYAFTLVLPA